MHSFSYALQEIQLSFNEISSLSTFEVFTDGSVAAVLATMEKLKLSNNNLRDFPLRVAEVLAILLCYSGGRLI